MKSFFIALFAALIGAVVSSIALQYIDVGAYLPAKADSETSHEDPFLEYYTTEVAVAVSPHDLRMEMDRGLTDTIIVDLRSRGEYEAEHIRGAISIPGTDGDKDAQAQETRIIAAFEKLPKDKRIIVHCYTHYCMLAKHVGLMLAKEGIRVHELNIGWNEWRYQWDLWNGEGTSKSVNIFDYIEGTAVPKSGSGVTKTSSGGLDLTPCTADGLAGC